MYSAVRSSVMAQVWRGRGSSGRFQLVGQSLVALGPDRVTTVSLTPYERFSVRAGDVIGWYVLGEGLMYTTCEGSNGTVYETSVRDLSDLKVGMETNMTGVEACRVYSMDVTVAPG